jgi:hypothetical protein
VKNQKFPLAECCRSDLWNITVVSLKRY